MLKNPKPDLKDSNADLKHEPILKTAKGFYAKFLPTVCVTCVWAGVDSVWEQGKLEARKMLENAAESHTSGARFVRRRLLKVTILADPLILL